MKVLPPRPFLYPIVDVATLGTRSVGASVAALARGGARLIQFRAKGLTDRAFLERGREAVEAAREVGALLIVNDRVDVALVLGADGVHVGQEDLPPRECRRLLGAEAIVGVSTHNRDEVLAARSEPVDYVAVGPIFPTLTKEVPEPVVGIELLRQARGASSKPLVAIGGIKASNAALVVSAGVDGLAVASDLLRQVDLAEAARAFCKTLGELL